METWGVWPKNDLIEVSTSGSVRYKLNKLPVNQSVSNWGYRTVVIGKTFFVHRLVASTFIPNPENLPAVNHKDGNKLNNLIDNLEWITVGDNVKHYFRELRPSRVNPKPKKEPKPKRPYDPKARRVYVTLPPVA